MWQAIISLIGGPVVKGLLDAYSAKLKAGVADNKIASDLAATEVASQERVRIAEVGRPWEPEKLAFYVVLFYMAKVMIWDAALHLGTTDVVKGPVGVWAGLVVSYYFGKRLIERLFRK